MKTLVIHPKDSTTDFLKPIYNKLDNKEVVTQHENTKELRSMVEMSDRVMMMGHGMHSGLLNMGQFTSNNMFVIDCTYVELLEKKQNCLFIWCYADAFVNKYGLKGFYTGMFVSEVSEAAYCGLGSITQEVVDESNTLFASLLSEVADCKTQAIYEYVKNEYGKLCATNPVVNYNHTRLYYN